MMSNANSKAHEPAKVRVLHRHIQDLGPCGPTPELGLEFLQLVRSALGQHFHAAVAQVAGVSFDANPQRGTLHEIAKADALDAASHAIDPAEHT
jgi:hypothetical protein